MSYGLRVWNSSGVLTLDISERLSQVITYGTAAVPANGSINIYVSGMVPGGSWYVFVCPANIDELPDTAHSILRPAINYGYFTLTNSYTFSGFSIKYTVFRR